MVQMQETVEPSTVSHEDVDDFRVLTSELQLLPAEIMALGEVALSGLATADAQLVEEVPSPEIERLDNEEERRKIFDTNAKKLKNRFGEEFVKGRRREDGQYEGLGARELLSKYLSIPGSADKIKRFIPNTHDALKTLQDNSDYIAALLAISYEKVKQLEKDEPPRDPYELAKNAGYELSGPFEEAEEFARYKADFRDGERICTYNNPEDRLKGYHMLWLRSADVDQTLPANELDENNISESWKKYLRTIGRYEVASDTYNLEGLTPSRQDPYGTSSMSVQVSRAGTHVSIKNRYNHTVNSPDSTFDNNLDYIAYGLKRAVYSRVGREDLMESPDHEPSDGYIADNEGGIHLVYSERDNIYFGYYEHIENGVVTTIDRGQYDMVSPDLYVSKRGDGEVKYIASGQKQTKFEILDTTRRVSILDERNTLEQFYDYSYDERQVVDNLMLTVAEGAKIGDVIGNPALTKLTVAEGAEMNRIDYSPALTNIVIAKDAKMQIINYNPALSELTLAEGAAIDHISHNLVLTDLVIPKDAVIGDIYDNPALAKLIIAENAKVGNIYDNPDLSNLTIAEGVEMGDLDRNIALTDLVIPKDARAGGITGNPYLKKVAISSSATVGLIYYNHPDIEIRNTR